VKVSVKPEIAAAFKSACAAGGASMAGVLSRCMSEYAGIAVKSAALPKQLDTRPGRRQAVRKVAQLIETIRDAEEGYTIIHLSFAGRILVLLLSIRISRAAYWYHS
jgi:hypothetical protein